MSLLANSLVSSLLAVAKPPVAPEAAGSSHAVMINLLIFLALVVVSMVVGRLLGTTLRMKDYSWKFALICFALVASIAIIARGWPPKLGPDLAGGTILVYQVDHEKHTSGVTNEEMQKLVRAVSERVNPGGQKEITVRPLGGDKIQITIPVVAAEEGPRIRKVISDTGTLEFRILANQTDHRGLIELAAKDPEAREVVDETGKPVGRWVPINHEQMDRKDLSDCVTRMGSDGSVEVLVHYAPYDGKNGGVTGEMLIDARDSRDEKGGLAVSFRFNSTGARKFERLTSDNPPSPDGKFKRRLGIILRDELFSAPTVNSTISDQGQISGRFTPKEVDDLVRVLNAGSLPVPLQKKAVRDWVAGPTLGGDTIQSSRNAMIISSILVPLFMVWYYRFSGLVANLALALNMIMLVAIMILINAPFTLSALAGLALTVGMAVDNNVLIYERLREELHHGAALRMAIRNAFHRAGVVIVDANITHLIAATVLFSRGTEQVKGFAITFWLGAVLSIWATMFVARVMFEVSERKGWLKQAKMLQLIGHTEIDFMRWFPLAATFSVIISIAGLLVAYARGPGLFDIDFTGGVSIQALFNDSQNIGKVRQETSHLPDVAVSNVALSGETPNTRFMINTSNDKVEEVKKELETKFGKQLASNKMTFSNISPITAPAEKPKAEPKPQVKAEPKPEAKPEVKTEPKPEAKPEVKPEPKAEPKPEAKPVEPKAEAKPEAKTEPKAEPKPEAKPELKAEPKPEPKAEAKPEEKPEAKPAEKTEKQSRNDLPPDTMVAMAGPASILLAQAEKNTPEKPVAEKPVAEKPAAEKPAAEKSAVEEAPAVPKKPVEPKPAATESRPKPAAAPRFPEPPPRQAPKTLPAKSFIGGTQAALEFKYPINYETVQGLVNAALEAQGLKPEDGQAQVTRKGFSERDTGSYTDWTLKAQLPATEVEKVLQHVEASVAKMPYFPDVDQIGAAVASDTQYYAIIALVASWSLIILYLWIRFQAVAFGVAAVIALVHDVLIMLGAIALSYYIPAWLGAVTLIEPFKINLQIVAAFLTIIGYSVNDTIVVFDRIREVRGKDPRLTREMVNLSTNQTLSRTLLTSFTVLLVVVIMYIFGGQALRGFSFALLAGVVTGTYSSIYVAAPILLWLIHPDEMRQRSSDTAVLKSK